jgi:hypothetical protein
MKPLIVICSLLVILLAISWHSQAQTSNTVAWQVGVNGPHTTCAVVANQTNFCFATDGLWQSINGTPYAQIAPTTPIGTLVTSVNGKTGAVVLAIQ